MDEEQTRSIKIIQCKISKSDLDQLDNPQTTQEHIIINDSNLKSENYFYNENKLLKSNLSFNENQINSLKEQLFILTEQNQKIKQESSLLSNTISSLLTVAGAKESGVLYHFSAHIGIGPCSTPSAPVI